MDTYLNRKSNFPIFKLFLSRVSSRALSATDRLTDEEVLSLFEAARWAPSCYNNQPWRFLYVRRGDPEWERVFDALIDFNKEWCKNADTLVVVFSRKLFERNQKESPTASFDTGAAWMSLALEAHSRGFVAHGMAGFDKEKIRKAFAVPQLFNIEAMIAIGKKGAIKELSEELQKMETPSERKNLETIVQRGQFNWH